MGERRLSSEEARRMAALSHEARREQFEECAAGRERVMRMRREPLRFVYPDEWTTPSAIEIASWGD